MQKLVIGIVATCAILAMVAGAASAQSLSAGGKCEAAKNQEAGKYAACLHKAEARRIKTKGQCSITSATRCFRDDDCPLAETCTNDLAKVNAAVAKCGTKFAGKWDKLTQQAMAKADPCPDGLLVDDIQDAVDDHVANVAGGLAGEGLTTCTGGPECGNGVVDAGEDCDLGNLAGASCVSEGFAGGVLHCGAGCVYDSSECYALRFVDNADGTISDNDTGLMWEKKVKLDSTADLANLQDADNFYRWSGTCSVATSKRCQPDAAASAACFAGVGGDSTGCDECTGGDGVCNVSAPGITIWQWLNDLNAANYGGHNDWRVPVQQELVTLVDYEGATAPVTFAALHGAACGAACTEVNDPACACTQSSVYWSASTRHPSPGSVWSVYFDSGIVDTFAKTLSLYVRAVRGGS